MVWSNICKLLYNSYFYVTCLYMFGVPLLVFWLVKGGYHGHRLAWSSASSSTCRALASTRKEAVVKNRMGW